MRIALLAPLWKKVPPQKYGGSELVVANLAKGLTDLGHSVTTFACAGSEVAGNLISVIPKPMYELTGKFRWDAIEPYEFLSYFALASRARDFDVVHNHMGIHPVAFAPLLPVPMLTTLHSSMPPDFPYLADAFQSYPFVSISDSQRLLAPALRYVATVHHGINVNSFQARLQGEGNGFVFLGTLSQNKGVDIAVRTARTLDLPLTIAGEIREEDSAFLDKEVFPYVDGKKIRFIGEVDHREKAELLKSADALLFPSRWNEAFGLVMVEALACGTPVIALANGAAPEILENGTTGFIASDEESFVENARSVRDLSRKACRDAAEEKFDLSIMSRKYVEVYQSLSC